MNDDLKDLVRRMLAILDIEEESDNGIIFHPTTIRSCRAGDAAQLEVILERMKAIVQHAPKKRESSRTTTNEP